LDGLLAKQHGAAGGHDEGDDAVDALGRVVLGGLRVAGGIAAEFAVIQQSPDNCHGRASTVAAAPGAGHRIKSPRSS
jgi:hypothetical protein